MSYGIVSNVDRARAKIIWETRSVPSYLILSPTFAAGFRSLPLAAHGAILLSLPAAAGISGCLSRVSQISRIIMEARNGYDIRDLF